MKQLLIFTFTLMILVSCGEPSEVIEEIDIQKYYPLNIGDYWKYQVDSVRYIDHVKDTSSIFLKEIVTDTFTENNNLVFLVEEQISKEQNSNYKYNQSFVVKYDDTQIVKVHDNLPFIKLVEPVILGKSHNWNGNNLFNTDEVIVDISSKQIKPYENWQYYYSKINSAVKVNNIAYDSTLEVNQIDYIDAIQYSRAQEYYSKNVGLTFSEIIMLRNDQTLPEDSTTFVTQAGYGYSVFKNLIEYGK